MQACYFEAHCRTLGVLLPRTVIVVCKNYASVSGNVLMNQLALYTFKVSRNISFYLSELYPVSHIMIWLSWSTVCSLHDIISSDLDVWISHCVFLVSALCSHFNLHSIRLAHPLIYHIFAHKESTQRHAR